ncbi:MAG: VOC family protein [Defluviitaleaceae bacterium]|nr:VOC family protein [Defluviitaleaceae bacterium]
MEKNMLNTQTVVQIGILVHDIEKSAQVYADFLGVDNPGWSWTGTLAEAETEFRGNPSEARSKLAFFKIGETLQLELIEPDHHPSTWREDLDANGEGVHHIAFNVKGMKEITMKLEKNGIPLIQKGEYTGGRYAYFDSKEQLKTVLELLEND